MGDVVEEGERRFAIGVDEKSSNGGLMWVTRRVGAESRDVEKV